LLTSAIDLPGTIPSAGPASRKLALHISAAEGSISEKPGLGATVTTTLVGLDVGVGTVSSTHFGVAVRVGALVGLHIGGGVDLALHPELARRAAATPRNIKSRVLLLIACLPTTSPKSWRRLRSDVETAK
jgi:hypothetical protein